MYKVFCTKSYVPFLIIKTAEDTYKVCVLDLVELEDDLEVQYYFS